MDKCSICKGAGWFSDTTYNRTGEDILCFKCRGTGLSAERMSEIINKAVAPFQKEEALVRAGIVKQEDRPC